MGKQSCLYTTLLEERLERRLLRAPSRRWEDNDVHTWEVACEDMNWIELAFDCVRRWVMTWAVLSLLVRISVGCWLV